MRRQLRAFADFRHWLQVRLREDRLLQVSGSLTFTTLLALVPVVTIALTVFSAFPAFGGFWSVVRNFMLAHLVPASASKLTGVYVQQFAENAGRLTALGMAMLGVAAIMMMLTMEHTFNRIWRVRLARPVVARVLIYWGVLTVGPLLLGASLSLTSWLITQSTGMIGRVRGAEAVLLKVVPLVLTCLAFAFLYRTVPYRRVQTADAVAGGALAGLLFELMKSLFGAYIKQVPTYKLVYGAFASFPIFLTWIYVSWLIVLIGAELSAAMPYLRTGGVRLRSAPGGHLLDAVRLLRLLYEAHNNGAVLTTGELRAALKTPWEECEALLERLAKLGWAVPAAGERWVLARDVGQIRLAEVYREFVFDADAQIRPGEEGYEAAVARLAADVQEDLSMTLESLFEDRAPGRGAMAAKRARAA
jgi:membrane protein